jgi:hypothetical protein
VDEFKSSGGKLESVLIKDNRTGKEQEINPAGVFIFVGQF